jgi:hypothetical protein
MKLKIFPLPRFFILQLSPERTSLEAGNRTQDEAGTALVMKQ